MSAPRDRHQMQARVQAILRRIRKGAYTHTYLPVELIVPAKWLLDILIAGSAGKPTLIVQCGTEDRAYAVPLSTLADRELPADLLQAWAAHDPRTSAVVVFDAPQTMGAGDSRVHFARLLLFRKDGVGQRRLAIFRR